MDKKVSQLGEYLSVKPDQIQITEKASQGMPLPVLKILPTSIDKNRARNNLWFISQ
jgi:hypothetical protein